MTRPMKDQPFDKQANTGIRHLVNAARFSLQGLKACWRHEDAFRQEVVGFALLLPLGAWLATSLGDFLLLACACLLALAMELLNSGIEAAIDRFGGERHEMSGRAKDYGSAAVMMSLVIVGLVFAYILFRHFHPAP